MSSLTMLAETAVASEALEASNSAGKDGETPCSTLRDLLTRQGAGLKSANSNKSNKSNPPRQGNASLEDIIQKVAETTTKHTESTTGVKKIQLQHYVPKNGQSMLGRDAPIPTFTLKQTSLLFPQVKHEWLDNGRLLRLMDPHGSHNLKLFQQQWRRAQVIISHIILPI